MSELYADVETISSLALDDPALLEMAGDSDPSSYAALCPPLARIVCVGLFCSQSKKYSAIFDASLVDVRDGDVRAPDEHKVVLQPAMCEADLLQKLAISIASRRRLVTFNGRSFDIPVALLRYVLNGLPVPALLRAAAREPRYRAGDKHRDLLEEMTCQGAARRFPLRALAKGLRLPDPKSGGDGGHVSELVAARNGTDLINYCLGDVYTLRMADARWMEANA